jgi:hypothetical protein
MTSPDPTGTKIITNLSNRDFLETYAKAGRIGLSGGLAPSDKAIQRAERRLGEDWGVWTHAFIFQGRRHDGHHWVVESNLNFQHKHIRLGAQENRISNFFDPVSYPFLAILDFDLPEPQVGKLLGEALDLVAGHARYSINELIGTLFALKFPSLRERARDNLLSRDRSFYCCAFVHHLFQKIGIDLAPGVHSKQTTPEDISHTETPHVTYLLQRDLVRGPIEKIVVRERRRIKARIRSLKK